MNSPHNTSLPTFTFVYSNIVGCFPVSFGGAKGLTGLEHSALRPRGFLKDLIQAEIPDTQNRRHGEESSYKPMFEEKVMKMAGLFLWVLYLTKVQRREAARTESIQMSTLALPISEPGCLRDKPTWLLFSFLMDRRRESGGGASTIPLFRKHV